MKGIAATVEDLKADNYTDRDPIGRNGRRQQGLHQARRLTTALGRVAGGRSSDDDARRAGHSVSISARTRTYATYAFLARNFFAAMQ